MSPLSFHYIRSIPTDLDLNGPTLSYSTQPTNQSKSHSGIATFVGIATATFPNSADNTGSISYQWYEVGVGAVSNGTNVTGAATTTLTISNLVSPTDNGRRFYLNADYVPSDDTGNAINDGLNSNTASLSVKPFITINTQPTGITTIGTDATATISVDASLSDTSYGSLSYQWKLNGSNLSDSSTVVGSATSILNISRSTIGLSTLSVDISAPSADTVSSNDSELDVVQPRSIIKIEAYTADNKYKTQTINLNETTSFSITDSTFGTDYSVIQMHAAEKNTSIRLGLFGSKGNNSGSNIGGEGGYSNISITLDKEVEHTILGINNNSAIFLYRGSNLIAVVGEGGDAGTSGNGGFGGGINVAGDDGTGSNNAGQGANVPTLSSSGIFGSIFAGSTITLNSGDSIATAPDGGRTLSCSEGSYWMNQGISACSNNSSSKIKYVGRDGTTISNSSSLIRGFKPGYSISNTSGLGVSNGGNGGNGAAGGSGGSAGAGGGGGSGFGDGSFSVLSASSGGSLGKATVNLSLAGDFYVDSSGRILILSCVDTRDPRTLTKTTGIVNIGDNACIDDARWQKYLDLARDGTQDYRLTATLNNSSVKITNATEKNIYRMMNANKLTLRTSLTGWQVASSGRLELAHDENDGANYTGSDYSMLWFVITDNKGWGYYGGSDNPFFNPTTHSKKSANWWILPPGVPDF